MLADMRSICFNLMPKTLENFGLVQAIRELCNYPGLKEQTHFSITSDEVFPVLNKNMEIGIFRIVQEFINNAQKHGKATGVDISLKTMAGNQIKIILQDDGTGFEITKSGSFQGMGLKNVQSRVSSYNGEIVITSSPGKGTRYVIIFPLDTKSNNYGSNREKKAAGQTINR
jgi:signal transduction histidine kinase